MKKFLDPGFFIGYGNGRKRYTMTMLPTFPSSTIIAIFRRQEIAENHRFKISRKSGCAGIIINGGPCASMELTNLL